MKIQRGMECRASTLTLKFGTTSTAELSAVSAGRTLLPGKFLGRCHLKCDDTRAETTFRLSAKRTSPFKSRGASVQSTTGSRGVRMSGSNAGYTMFRGSVKWYWLPTPFASFPFPSPTMRHRVTSHFSWTLLISVRS